jgi:hypothetical protein
MPNFNELLPKAEEIKIGCDVCGKQVDLMHYKDLEGNLLRVCSNECLFDVYPDHPVLDSCGKNWKKIRLLEKAKAEIEQEIALLRKE